MFRSWDSTKAELADEEIDLVEQENVILSINEVNQKEQLPIS